MSKEPIIGVTVGTTLKPQLGEDFDISKYLTTIQVHELLRNYVKTHDVENVITNAFGYNIDDNISPKGKQLITLTQFSNQYRLLTSEYKAYADAKWTDFWNSCDFARASDPESVRLMLDAYITELELPYFSEDLLRYIADVADGNAGLATVTYVNEKIGDINSILDTLVDVGGES